MTESSGTPAPRALVLFANGFEEIETVTVIDVMRRGGIEVVAAGLKPGPITGAHGIVLIADASAANCQAGDFDAVVLPGGMPNARSLAEDPQAQRILAEARDQDCVIGAICAAPVALLPLGLLDNHRHTSHPSVQPELPAAGYQDSRVVVDGRLLTSRGPGTSLEFGLALVAHLQGPERAQQLAGPMQVKA